MTIDAVEYPMPAASKPLRPDSDAKLLRSFVAERRELAFEELMRRHGPMVMGVCRRMLPDRHDAEDAYQATFLLLVQKSATIRRPERLANWLFGVAYRVAARIRAKTGRQESLSMQPLEAPAGDNTVEVERRELQSVLAEELHCLPVKYRLPLILCYLEGKTHVEAARELGWPSGSMSSRLTLARDKLRRRLARRGLALTSALLGMLLREQPCGASLSPALIEQTTRAAMICASGKPLLADVVSARVAGLLADLNKRMVAARGAAVLLLLLLLLGAAGNAVCLVHGQTEQQADAHDGTITHPVAAPSEFASLTRPRSPDGASADARSTSTAAAPKASVSSCGQH
jgi:RNA polymerase sigma-70 factor (ECF subfamily)